MSLEDAMTYGSEVGQERGDNEAACDARTSSWEGLRP